MPTIDENVAMWNSAYAWTDQEEEWSSGYPGGSKTLWFGIIFPRIHHFLPTTTILEIAPGMGRWTQYLRDLCNHLVVVDLSEKCIETCKSKFSSSQNISYYVNDGKSLEMVEDGSIDFVYSFDSLVHAEADVVEEYLNQIATKLKSNGVGFIHHSNLKDYSNLKYLPRKLRTMIRYGKTSWRADTVNAELFEQLCKNAKLHCVSQELINWDTHGLFLTDTFSIFCKKVSARNCVNQVIKNRNFMEQCKYVIKLAGASRECVSKGQAG